MFLVCHIVKKTFFPLTFKKFIIQSFEANFAHFFGRSARGRPEMRPKWRARMSYLKGKINRKQGNEWLILVPFNVCQLLRSSALIDWEHCLLLLRVNSFPFFLLSSGAGYRWRIKKGGNGCFARQKAKVAMDFKLEQQHGYRAQEQQPRMNFPETKAESKVFCNKRQSRNMRTVQGMFNEACETAAISISFGPSAAADDLRSRCLLNPREVVWDHRFV